MPFASLVEPEVDDGPVIDAGLAMARVTEAAAKFAAARAAGYNSGRAEKPNSIDAVRTAYRSGARQCDIAVASNGILRPEDVLTAIRERKRQPRMDDVRSAPRRPRRSPPTDQP